VSQNKVAGGLVGNAPPGCFIRCFAQSVLTTA
jgi:hypothetical protein